MNTDTIMDKRHGDYLELQGILDPTRQVRPQAPAHAAHVRTVPSPRRTRPHRTTDAPTTDAQVRAQDPQTKSKLTQP